MKFFGKKGNKKSTSGNFTDAIKQLKNILGKERVLDNIEERICYSFDGTKQRALPDVVVKPISAEQISETVKIASEFSVPVYPRGAGTGLTGGAVPVKGGIVIDIMQMNKILEINPQDMTATVEPAVITKVLQDEVAKHRLFYPPDPSSADSSTMGGNVAECAGGITGVKYGVTRNYILALEVVLADGTIMKMGRKTLKSVTGYDLTRLFVGSEGTLGIFTKISVRLIPMPQKISTVLAYYHNLDDALNTADGVIDHNILPRTLELMDEISISAVKNYGNLKVPDGVKALLIIDVDGHEAAVKEELKVVEEVCRKNNAIELIRASNSEEREALWAVRRSISPALFKIAPLKINEDICVPRSKIKEILDKVKKSVEGTSICMAIFGHVGDGNLHLNYMHHENEKELVHELVTEIFKEVVAVEGTISGEHGIGMTKREYIDTELTATEIDVMKSLKDLFDPKGILNPGKMFPAEDKQDAA
ncbi:MAG: FAD-binding oxidoreductase [Candidatus Anammoxibacter sp.]